MTWVTTRPRTFATPDTLRPSDLNLIQDAILRDAGIVADDLSTAACDALGISQSAAGHASEARVRRGSSHVTTEQTTTSASYVSLATADKVSGLWTPGAAAILVVRVMLNAKVSGGTGQCALYVDGVLCDNNANTGAGLSGNITLATYSGKYFGPRELDANTGWAGSIDPLIFSTTSQPIALGQPNGANPSSDVVILLGAAATQEEASDRADVEVRYQVSGGNTLSAKDRHLWVKAVSFS